MLWKRLGAFSLVVATGACAQHLQNQSAESERLRAEVVPQLIAWAESDSKELELGTLNALQGFDQVCYLWEYQEYEKIEQAVGPIDGYFGAYEGVLVPENQMAIVAVRGKHAHVAHMPLQRFSIGRGGDKNCVALQHGRLVKESNSPDGHFLARLRETKEPS
jgi:hypothetical protein